jgi:hypothetical protein
VDSSKGCVTPDKDDTKLYNSLAATEEIYIGSKKTTNNQTTPMLGRIQGTINDLSEYALLKSEK